LDTIALKPWTALRTIVNNSPTPYVSILLSLLYNSEWVYNNIGAETVCLLSCANESVQVSMQDNILTLLRLYSNT